MASKKQHEVFNKKVHRLLIGLGATQPGKWSYKYAIETMAGSLYLSIHEAEKSAVFSVYCRFENPEKAKEIFGDGTYGRLNPYSGKWNYHEYEAENLLQSLETNLTRILEPVNKMA